jgi:hypothetical protein
MPFPNTIAPAALQLPPSGNGASASVCGGPEPASIRFSFPDAKKPIERLSGDQKRRHPSWQGSRVQRIEAADPEHRDTVGAGRDERDLAAVGRQRLGAGIRAESRLVWWRHRELHHLRRGRDIAPAGDQAGERAEQRDEHQRGEGPGDALRDAR